MMPSVKIAFLFLLTWHLSKANIQTIATTFTRGKAVATSHTVLHSVSKSQCVEKCKKGTCVVAGYNTATRACYLSVDSQQDVIDVADESSGVFFLQGTQHILPFNVWSG